MQSCSEGEKASKTPCQVVSLSMLMENGSDVGAIIGSGVAVAGPGVAVNVPGVGVFVGPGVAVAGAGVRSGVAVGSTGAGVRVGSGVAVGGTGVGMFAGPGVAAGGTGVGVFVGSGVAVGGTGVGMFAGPGVAAGGTGVGVFVGSGASSPQATRATAPRIASTATQRIQSRVNSLIIFTARLPGARAFVATPGAAMRWNGLVNSKLSVVIAIHPRYYRLGGVGCSLPIQ